jgi:hypothetical protein
MKTRNRLRLLSRVQEVGWAPLEVLAQVLSPPTPKDQRRRKRLLPSSLSDRNQLNLLKESLKPNK